MAGRELPSPSRHPPAVRNSQVDRSSIKSRNPASSVQFTSAVVNPNAQRASSGIAGAAAKVLVRRDRADAAICPVAEVTIGISTVHVASGVTDPHRCAGTAVGADGRGYEARARVAVVLQQVVDPVVVG